MSNTDHQALGALELGRLFFWEVVQPAMERACPDLLAHSACGRFGWGSECLGLDDEFSRDHHWGPRVDVLLPHDLFESEGRRLGEILADSLPREYRGLPLEPGHVGGSGIAPESLSNFLIRNIGRATPPQTYADWLRICEEDLLHVVNGEVWHDGPGEFTRVRDAIRAYYPDPVWKCRLAFRTRYASGFGLYHMYRALRRDNRPLLHSAFGQLQKYTMELTFLLNRTYYPYIKWLYPMFRKLPVLAPELDPLLVEANRPHCPWKRRIELGEQMHELIDRHMIDEGLIPDHPRFQRSPTTGYRLLEWAMRELLLEVPADLIMEIPLEQQIHVDRFVLDYIVGVNRDAWEEMLNLKPAP